MLIFNLIAAALCVGFLSFGSCLPIIIPISSFKQIDVAAFDKHKPEDILMLVDVDDTLVSPSDAVLAVEGRLSRFIKKIPFNRAMHDSVKQQAERPLIESCSVEILAQLQQKGIPVIACTAMKTGCTSPGFCREQWRYNHLKTLGFVGSFHEQTFEMLNFIDIDRKPVFYHGILCADLVPKGPAVDLFLASMELSPRCIVMVDDAPEQLASVEAMCTMLNIEFIGYEYQRLNVIPLDEDIAAFQVVYFYSTGVWLSDEAARCESERCNTMLQNNEMSTCWSVDGIQVCK